jgi:hypothetical protein
VKKWLLLLVAAGVLVVMGCATPNTKVHKLLLGMTTNDVLKVMGKPFSVRASKVYENGETTVIWEYIAPIFSMAIISDDYNKRYWIIFENEKMVQWGEPGDLTGTDQESKAIKEYYNKKLVR